MKQKTVFFLFLDCLTLKMKALWFFKPLATHYPMSNPEDLYLQHVCENLISRRIDLNCCNDGDIMSHWNGTMLLPDYMVAHPRDYTFIVTAMNWVIACRIWLCSVVYKYCSLIKKVLLISVTVKVSRNVTHQGSFPLSPFHHDLLHPIIFTIF
jgi:hypothetical protein